jgi:hypothetical protein
MNLPRSVLALAFISVLAGTAFAATGDAGKTSDEKAAKAPCGCAVKADGKVCGADKDCCCTGEKATKAPAKSGTPAGK